LLSRAKSVGLGIPHQKVRYPTAKVVLRRIRAADAVDHSISHPNFVSKETDIHVHVL